MTEQAHDEDMNEANPRLVELIGSQIQAAGGFIPFVDYMELVLYHPQYGYYTRPRKRIGKDGDFITSVSIGRCFGKLLARHFASYLGRMGDCCRDLVLVEPGAEDGHLALDVMRELKQVLAEEVYNRLCYVAIEPFDGKKERLLDIFGSEDSDRFRVVSSLNDLKGSSGVLMANEFLDAMPIERLRWREGEWWRICVASDPQKATPFHEVEAPIQDPELAGLVDDLPIHLEDGFTIELNTNLKQWFHDLAQNFNMLYCCLIDYGFEGGEVFSPSRKGGTLRGYLRHRFQNCPFDAPGMTDLTAHVDFDRVKKSATSVGFDILNFTDQHRFLVNAARPWLLEIEGVGSTEDENRQLLKQFQTLSHPTMMGGVFKVLEIGRGVTAP